MTLQKLWHKHTYSGGNPRSIDDNDVCIKHNSDSAKAKAITHKGENPGKIPLQSVDVNTVTLPKLWLSHAYSVDAR